MIHAPGWHPAATAEIEWLPAEAGGHSSGPPRPGDYAANAVFLTAGEPERADPWNADTYLSIVIRLNGTSHNGRDVADVGFLAPEIASEYLQPGRALLVMEGPTVVAEARITSLID
ncbi:hypothetical protein [Actinokineospora inagensis]|uniref:hypothetical protein n=1 Tax=Actinokineospora inagensis TaxID=103730 RepID=UPI0004113D37|nr:hypothetical protein [Actinokineospora inagensis]